MAVTKIAVGPQTLDFSLYAGDGFAVKFTFSKPDGQPWDASGEWEAQIRPTPDADTVLLEWTIDDSEAATGVIRLSLTGDEIRELQGAGGGVYDLQQTVPGEEPRTWYSGKVTATLDVTRA